MRRTLYAPVGLLVLLLATQSNSLFAQKIELDPCYASLFRIECAAHAEFKDEDFYGVRGRLFLTDRASGRGTSNSKTIANSRILIREAGPRAGFWLRAAESSILGSAIRSSTSSMAKSRGQIIYGAQSSFDSNFATDIPELAASEQ